MSKPVLGLLLGAILGAFDGLTALLSAPETAPQIMGIVIGSTVKGLIVGAIVGWYATRVQSLAKGLIVGAVVAAFFAFLIAGMQTALSGLALTERITWLRQRPEGHCQIMIPGTIVGLIVGYATQTFGRTAGASR